MTKARWRPALAPMGMQAQSASGTRTLSRWDATIGRHVVIDAEMANMKIISMFAEVMRREKPNPKDFEAILLPRTG